MGQLSTVFQSPLHWQDFEELTRGVASVTFGDTAFKHGRSGQEQAGVDVFVQSHRSPGWIGIQCKQMNELDSSNNPRPGGTITKEFLRKQAENSEQFTPALSHFVLATTAKTNTGIQRFARELSDEYVRAGKFRISVWYWDFFEAVLNNDAELQQHYYQHVIGIRSAADQDRIILESIRKSFQRAAFETPIDGEHADDFLQALKDTSRMLATGVLVDRETGSIIQRTIGGTSAIDDPAIKDELLKAKEALKVLRLGFEDALASGKVVRRNGYVSFPDPSLGAKLEQDRALVIAHVEAALRAVGLSL